MCWEKEVIFDVLVVRGLALSDGDSSTEAVTDNKVDMMDMPHRISHVVSYK